MKRIVKLTEQDLYRIVKRVISEQERTQPQAGAQTTTQPQAGAQTSAFIDGVTRNYNNHELFNKYIGLGGINTSREAINMLLSDGDPRAKNYLINVADAERDKGYIGLASNFMSMIEAFLEITWKKKIDLTTQNESIFPTLLKNLLKNTDYFETYKTLTTKFDERAILTASDLKNIYNKLKEYQRTFRFS